MSRFEDRVRAATNEFLDDRFKILEKLDPEMAREYVVGLNVNNEERLRKGQRLTGFGRFSKEDVDAVLDAALDGRGNPKITKKEEEGLLIILASRHQWAPGAREYMIEQIEQNLKFLWSSTPIPKNEAASLLKYTDTIDFVSRGDRHQGTRLHYTPGDFQVIAGLIGQNEIGAWEVSPRRTYLRIPAGDAGAGGFQHSDADDIYIISGLSSRDRHAFFSHEATHALQDLENLPASKSLAKYVETDAYIVQAYVALKRGVPYAAYPDRPEEIATTAAVPLLQIPLRSRNDKWKSDFRKAYDKVVDAYVARHGRRDANEVINMLESKRRQREEKSLLQKMRKALRKKKRP